MEKSDKIKLVKLIIVILMLVGLFIFYTVPLVQINREKRILNYLTEKYNQEFEMVNLISTEQNTRYNDWINLMDLKCGTSEPIEGSYNHYYNVRSVKDDVNFKVVCYQRKGELYSFKDSYSIITSIYKAIDEIKKYAIDNNNSVEKEELSCDFYNKYIISIDLANDDLLFEKNEDYGLQKIIRKYSNKIKQENSSDISIDFVFIYPNGETFLRK